MLQIYEEIELFNLNILNGMFWTYAVVPATGCPSNRTLEFQSCCTGPAAADVSTDQQFMTQLLLGECIFLLVTLGLRAFKWSSTLVLTSRRALTTTTLRESRKPSREVTYFWVSGTEPQPPFEPPHTELVTISTAHATQTASVVKSEHHTGQKGKVCSCW